MTVEYKEETKQANKAARMMQRLHRGKQGRAAFRQKQIDEKKVSTKVL